MNRRSLSATEATNDIFSRAQQVLPSCYTPELDKCFNERPEVSGNFAHCDVINEAYDADHDRTQQMIDTMPICPGPNPAMTLVKLVGAGAVGATLGFLLGRRRA